MGITRSGNTMEPCEQYAAPTCMDMATISSTKVLMDKFALSDDKVRSSTGSGSGPWSGSWLRKCTRCSADKMLPSERPTTSSNRLHRNTGTYYKHYMVYRVGIAIGIVRRRSKH